MSDDQADLRQLQRLSWILANLITGGVKEPEDAPMIRMTPGLADRGTWCFYLDLNFSKDGAGVGIVTFSGTVDAVLVRVREELTARLGNGYL